MRTLIGIATTSFGGRLRPALDWAANQKAGGVELDTRRQVIARELGQTARRQLRHLLTERGLQLSGLFFPLRGHVADEDRLDARLAALTDIMTLAFDLSARAVVVPFRLPEEAERAAAIDVLTTLARAADHAGVLLTLRCGADAEETATLLRDASRSCPLAVQFDPLACVVSGQPLEDSLRALADWVTQIRIADGLRTSRGGGRETVVGRGEVDFDLLAAMSHELPTRAVVVSPDDATMAPLADGLAYAQAVFGDPLGG